MRKIALLLSGLSLAATMAVGGSALAAANDNASCMGTKSSDLAGQAGARSAFGKTMLDTTYGGASALSQIHGRAACDPEPPAPTVTPTPTPTPDPDPIFLS